MVEKSWFDHKELDDDTIIRFVSKMQAIVLLLEDLKTRLSIGEWTHKTYPIRRSGKSGAFKERGELDNITPRTMLADANYFIKSIKENRGFEDHHMTLVDVLHTMNNTYDFVKKMRVDLDVV